MAKPNKNIKEWQKHAVMLEYAQRFGPKVFIETGTFRGETVKAMLQTFDKLFTVDTNAIYAQRAARRFRSMPKVRCFCGDSAEVLPKILVGIAEPCLFWLDAHCVGTKHDNYVVGAPIRAELDCILSHSRAADHIILIDDVWFFERGGAGIPSVAELAAIVHAKFPDWCFETGLDIIRCHRTR